ncbi:unnamed protein product [Caenorhabditis bovis]|uniref:Uncharacterized protein n=1 Tax=Caenorhabditis bovis TaxID=2654633 RepID=A0A8S1EWH6_9PELO|nr:unnamed protein product [Caenorhabditis bovis]
MLSAAHNVLYFVLDIKLFVTSFLQYLFTFLFLHLLKFANFVPIVQIPKMQLFYAAGAKFVETILAAFANSHNRTGELYLVRVFDFFFTFSIVFYHTFRAKHGVPMKPESFLIIPLGLFVSISWLEPGQLEYSAISAIAAFLLPFARAASLILLKNAFESTGKVHLNAFCLEYTRYVCAFLAIPALFSYLGSSVEVTASWESIDYVLMYLSFLYMICNQYSDLWLSLSLNSNSYVTLDNTKYLLASCAQWIIQNMAHPNILAFGAKFVAFSCLFRIWTRFN